MQILIDFIGNVPVLSGLFELTEIEILHQLLNFLLYAILLKLVTKLKDLFARF
jgi:hypothetical protein